VSTILAKFHQHPTSPSSELLTRDCSQLLNEPGSFGLGPLSARSPRSRMQQLGRTPRAYLYCCFCYCLHDSLPTLSIASRSSGCTCCQLAISDPTRCIFGAAARIYQWLHLLKTLLSLLEPFLLDQTATNFASQMFEVAVTATCFSGKNYQQFSSKTGVGADPPRKAHGFQTTCFRAGCLGFGTFVRRWRRHLRLAGGRS